MQRSDWQWIQLNIGLVRRHYPAIENARQLFAVLVPLTLEWRAGGNLQCFFFMRKPPDIRLRFFCNTPEQIIEQLNALTEQLLEQDVIDQCFFSQYEPECDRFGGEVPMTFVHDYFDQDTAQWWILDLLKQQGQQSVSDNILLTIILQDLFEITFPTHHIWQVWQRLGTFFETKIHGSELNQTVLSGLRNQIETQTQEKQILQNYCIANIHLSQNLHKLWQVGHTTSTLLDALATIGQFTLHRHGFDAQRVEKLIGQFL